MSVAAIVISIFIQREHVENGENGENGVNGSATDEPTVILCLGTTV